MRTMIDDIAGKVALITDATSATGTALAKHLSGEGVRLALGARDKTELKVLADELVWDGGKVVAMETDMSESMQAGRLAAAAVEAFGRIDVVINNACPHQSPALYGDAAANARVEADLHMLGVVHSILAVVPHVGESRAHIIDVAPFHMSGGSLTGVIAAGAMRGVLRASRRLRALAAQHGMRMTLIAPSLSGTPRDQNGANSAEPMAPHGITAAAIARAVTFAIVQAGDMQIDEIFFRQPLPHKHQ